MKHLLLTTIAAVVLVGCGNPEADRALLEAVNIEEVKQHLAAGADVNAKAEDGWTPLHFATSGGYKEITELLISKGADVNSKDNHGRTPLDLAISRKHPETSDLIRKNGGKTRKELKAEGK